MFYIRASDFTGQRRAHTQTTVSKSVATPPRCRRRNNTAVGVFEVTSHPVDAEKYKLFLMHLFRSTGIHSPAVHTCYYRTR